MPQHKKKIPFSGKRKKEQLLAKRQSKGNQRYLRYDSNDDGDTTEDTSEAVQKLMAQPSRSRNKNVNRYNLQFYTESKKEIESIKQESVLPFQNAAPIEKEMDSDYFDSYDFPIRPTWNPKMSKEELDKGENLYFRKYVENLNQEHNDSKKSLSLFELNLETWRQLWRVLEMSDILLIIVDVRYATLMFPPALYSYIINTIKKHAILVLNKVDLVTPVAVLAWKRFFKEKYPGIPIVLFASYPSKKLKGSTQGRMGHRRCIEGVFNLYKECKNLTKDSVDLLAWETKIHEDMKEDFCSDDEQLCHQETLHSESTDFKYGNHEMFQNGILTIGCVGFPNVGKSSFINGLKGKKVVSVSRTPGHTKHFQTIFLTNNVKLCDSPGLVFPSSTPKYMQVLLGSYPISQLRQPYRSIKYLGEMIDLPKALKIQNPEQIEWSAVTVCEAWAMKRGFLTAKAARPDIYRAANNILRMCLSGQIVLQFFPPGFNMQDLSESPEIEEIKRFQGHIDDIEEGCSNYSTDKESDDGDDSDNESSPDESSDCDEDAFKPSRNVFAVLDEN